MVARIAFVLSCASLLWACGGDNVVPDDAGPETGLKHFDADIADVVSEPAPPKVDAGYPGPHPDAPQVVNYGGSVLTAPTVIPIFFKNDPYQTEIESFLAQTAASTYWTAATSEYGVGALTVGKSIVVTDTPPVTTSTAQIEAWLIGYLDGTHSEFPPIALNNIYTIFYQSSTTIKEQGFGQSCINYGGYHDEAKSAAKQSIVYAVLPRCASFGTLNGLDALTGPLSHELVEASTDPLVQSSPAWAAADTDHMVWNLMPLGEVGDMCAYEPQSYARIVGTYVVQRPWSNVSAKAGHDPCVPATSAPYFNAAPVLNDAITLDYYGQPVTTKGIRIPLNQSKTIDVQLFSDAPTTQWSVSAVDSNYGTSQPAELSFAWDTQYGNNGDTLHLTITRIANNTSFQGTEFFIYADRGASTWNMWFGFVGN